MAGGPLYLWNHRSMQILVLLSLGLQLVLFFFAGIRRHEASPMPKFFLWLAYLMADSTATYAVGHLSLTSAGPVAAFWAPFLLLHLGGPDNITAYALQDNQLWLRHLQTLVVQVLGAAYVLYKNVAGGGDLLLLTSILMFVVGVAKYGERTWALQRGNLVSIRSYVKKQPPAMHKHFHPHDEALDYESHLRRAHSLFHICKRAIVDYPVIETDSDTKMMGKVDLWTLVEIELSLMYDILYTKAAVIHTWLGYFLRVISPLATVTSLLLFQFTSKDGHSRVDVAITYVLLGGALFMETTSLLNALGSSWTFAFLSTTRWRWLRYAALCNERWDRLRRVVASLHHLVKRGGSSYRSRRWSGNVGQYNMLHFCTRPDGLTSPLLGRLAKMVGFDEWWSRKHYSETIKMSNLHKDRIYQHMKQLYEYKRLNSLGILRHNWGAKPLYRRGFYDGILKESLGVEFQQGIIVWHIGTDVFLAKSEQAKAEGASDRVEAIKVLSNYMMFLLVERPYMLPGLAQNRLYQLSCEYLIEIRSTPSRRKKSICAMLKNMFRLQDGPCSTYRATDREELANELYDEYVSPKFSHAAPRLSDVAPLAEQLLKKERDGTDSVELVLDMWTDFLIYAGNKCSGKSHAEMLSSGGELTTILWLMAEHLYQLSLEEV